VLHRAEYEREERRKALRSNFISLLAYKKERWQRHRKDRAALMGFDADDRSALVEL